MATVKAIAETRRVAAERTVGNASGEFPLQSPGSAIGGGRGGVLPRGAVRTVGNKADTSKSLHMGNLSGRGSRVSSEFKATHNNSGTQPVKVTKVLRSTFFADNKPITSVGK